MSRMIVRSWRRIPLRVRCYAHRIMESYFRQLLGDQDGAFATLRYLAEALSILSDVLTGYAFLQDVLLNPEAYEPEDLAALYLQKSLEFGFDGGFSEAYQMMQGASWTSEVLWTDKPGYLAAYGLWGTSMRSGCGISRRKGLIWWKPTTGCSKPPSPICPWKRSAARWACPT